MRIRPRKERLISAAYTYGVYPLTSWRRHRSFGYRLRQYERRERALLGENQELQWQALVRLFQHAYDTTDFYRRSFESAGLRPSEIKSPADLERIPPLTREDIRQYLPALRSNAYRPDELSESATGGTTDTPVPLLLSQDSIREKVAAQWRFNNWASFYPGDKVFYLWGARQDYSENPSWRWKLYDRYLMRQVWAPTSLFNEEVLESYRQSFNRFRPRIVYAYPTPLALFCEFLQANRRPFWQPRSAICTAEPLLDYQRRLIEKVLGCPVFDRYGSREFGTIAGECEQHQGMHLNPAAAYVEFVPVQGAEVEGLHEILVTDLLNYGMPLIRYRVNDCVLLGPESCACGRGYPLIRRIMGRTADVFYLPNGDVVPGVALTNRVLQVCPGLKKVQIIQETQHAFRARYVPGPAFSPSDLGLLRNNLGRFLPDNVHWSFEEAADIERERSGKTRFCISHVTKPAAVDSSPAQGGPR